MDQNYLITYELYSNNKTNLPTTKITCTGITGFCHKDKAKLKYITFDFKNPYSYENTFQLVLIGVKVTEN